jgi:hypothetical protein
MRLDIYNQSFVLVFEFLSYNLGKSFTLSQNYVWPIAMNSPTSCASAAWPALQDYAPVYYGSPEEHTNVNAEPKARSAASAGWAANDLFSSFQRY